MSEHDARKADESDNRDRGKRLTPTLSTWQKTILASLATTLGVAASAYQFLESFLPRGVTGVVWSVAITATAVAAVIGGLKVIPVIRDRRIPAWQALLVMLIIAVVAGITGYVARSEDDLSGRPADAESTRSDTRENPQSKSTGPPASSHASTAPALCENPPTLSFPQQGKTFDFEVNPGCAPSEGSTRWIVVEIPNIGEIEHSEYYFNWRIEGSGRYRLKSRIDNCSYPRNYFVAELTNEQLGTLGQSLPNEDPILKIDGIRIASDTYKVTC